MKNIKLKIFLASSVNELSDERLELKDFTRRLNDVLIDYDIRLKLFICEYADNAISVVPMQDEYNKHIDDSDIFIILVGEKLGEYTLKEYEYALGVRGVKQHPEMLAAYKASAVADEIISNFARRNSADGVAQISFATLAELKTAMAEMIEAKLGDAAELRIEDGRVTVNGKFAAKL